ncbi:hypothetical protein FGIG_07763 [Fasciola gigantica]|uniref:RING-type domain-containing protein n=1 Tax=Fasciola gigantica TaxID=46835 RepID=A0A504Y7E7_FASGI|nr:hypothetical protein FGIG_07763 [Fasciola gigantica]
MFTAPTTTSVRTSTSRRLSEAKMMWLVGKPTSDMIVGQLSYVIDDAHGVGQAATLVSFTTVPSLAVAVDTGGSVFALNLKRGFTGSHKDSVCFFSGSRGEICALDALGSTTLLPDGLLPHDESTVATAVSDRSHESGAGTDRSVRAYALVAMASFTKLIVVQLRPRLQIVHWQPLKGPVACLPLLAWMWSPRTQSSAALLAFGRGSTLHVLRVSIDTGLSSSTSLLLGLDSIRSGSTGSDERKSASVLHFHPLYSFELSYELISLHWISSGQIVALDTAENVHLMDGSTGEDAETTDLSGVQLCYSSYLFQSVADGGSVSEALAYAGRRSCSQSLDVHGSQMLVLGSTGVHLVALRTWSEIMHCLFTHGLFDTALIYCNRALDSIYVKQSPGSMVLLPPSVNSSNRFKVPSIPNTTLSWSTLQSDIQRMLRDLFCPLLCHQSITGPFDTQTDLTESIHPIGLLAITLVVRIACFLDNGCDFLVTELYQPLSRDPKTRTWLCLALYEILLCQLPSFGQLNNDRLKLPTSRRTDEPLNLATTLAYSLPPDLIMNWFTWCLTSEYDVDRIAWFRECNPTGPSADGRLWAEHVLLGLPPQCIDLNEAVRLCWQHHLFRAYLHIHTDILFDFETPFRHLIDQLTSRAQKPSAMQSSLSASPVLTDLVPYSQTLLLLLRNALAGESYSQQPLPSPLDMDVPGHIFNLLLNEAIPGKSSRRNHPHQPKYPRLWLMLNHCPTDFLNLLMLSISGDRFFSDGELGLSHRTHMYYKLIACALEDHWMIAPVGETTTTTSTPVAESNPRANPAHFAIPVFGFLVHQLTQYGNESIRFEDGKLFQLFEHICQELERTESVVVTDTLETSVIELIQTERFTQLDVCLRLAEGAKLYRIVEHINQRLGRRVETLQAQLARLDQAVLSHRVSESVVEQLVNTIFAFLEQLFPETSRYPTGHVCNLSPTDLTQTQSIVLERIQLLTTLDAERTLRLLYRIFRIPLPDVLSKVFPDLFNSPLTGHPCPNSRGMSGNACSQLLTAYYRSRYLYLDSHGTQSNMTSSRLTSDDPSLSESHNGIGWDQFLTQSHPEVAECYVQLLAESDQTGLTLLRFLNTNADYRLDLVLQILSPADFPQECAFLYEKQGRFDMASDIYEQMFVTKWHRLLALVVPAETEQSDSPPADRIAFESARSALSKAANLWFALTQRRLVAVSAADSPATSSEICEQVWFHVIDVLLREEQMSKSRALESDINDLFHSLLTYLPQTVSLTSIISYILQSATNETNLRFNPKTSRLLTRLVATCHTEVEQMSLNCELARRELTRKQSILIDHLKRGFTADVGEFWCVLCQSSLRSVSRIDSTKQAVCPKSRSKSSALKEKSIVAFRCGHMFHAHCLTITGAVETDPDEALSLFGFRRHWICPTCQTCPIRQHSNERLNSACFTQSHSNSVRPGEAIDEESFQSWYDPIRVEVRQVSSTGNPFA